ncbi:MAG: T9SS C-terminal target domain-containing protein [Sphingobacteriales bacterium]|nr:MAG: T9SS C-terminal target domain-containing protein [Sphingobacteriales bacterium]
MKTNLLKLAAGLCFSVVTLTANAQVDAVENFEYPAGALAGLNGGTGWDGAWKKGELAPVVDNDPLTAQVVAGNIGVNTVGNHAEFKGGWTAGRHRLFTNPVINEAGTSFWAGFNYHVTGTSDVQYGGFSFFNSDASNREKGYFGKTNDGLIGTGSAWPDNTFTGANSDQQGTVSVFTPHYYLIHATMFGDAVVRYDVWADYFGATAPMADFSEPTYQYTAWFNSIGSITQLRLVSAHDAGIGSFDGVKLKSTYFQTLNVLPLALTALNAKSTAAGNLVTWDFTSNDKVASISVLRKDASGNFVSIATLGKDAKSHVDANPLPGTNYYKLSSTDTDGSSNAYDLVASAKGFDVAPTFFPNPATGGVVNVVAGNSEVKSVSIFDLAGKKVASKAGAGAVNTSSLAKGVYIIEITSAASTTRSKLVVE